jgi:hypothetical protein
VPASRSWRCSHAWAHAAETHSNVVLFVQYLFDGVVWVCLGFWLGLGRCLGVWHAVRVLFCFGGCVGWHMLYDSHNFCVVYAAHVLCVCAVTLLPLQQHTCSAGGQHAPDPSVYPDAGVYACLYAIILLCHYCVCAIKDLTHQVTWTISATAAAVVTLFWDVCVHGRAVVSAWLAASVLSNHSNSPAASALLPLPALLDRAMCCQG